MKIDFNPAKDQANQVKHGVSLDFAKTVLADPNRADRFDARYDYKERRIISYAMVSGRVWVCVFTPRGDTYRVISLRKANVRETKSYHAATPRL
jgi:hypothetical protein